MADHADFWNAVPELAGVEHGARLSFGGNPRPLYLRIETVNACNNQCIICAYDAQSRAKAFMRQDLFEKAVRDYAALGGGFLSLTPLVGDVLLDRMLPERLEFLETVPAIRELGVTTNAAMAHRFDDAGLAYVAGRFDRIGISVYGTSPEEYQAMTRRDTYDRAVEGIRRMILASRGDVTLEFRLLRRQPREALWGWLADEVMRGESGLPSRVRINSVITDYANWGIFHAESRPLPFDARWFGGTPQTCKPQCMIPILCCIVLSNGNVSFCPCDNFDDVEELRLGNVAEASLAELYASDKSARLWQWASHGTPAFCQACTFHVPMAMVRDQPEILDDPHLVVGSG